MRDDHPQVPGHLGVEFEGADAESQRLVEAGEGRFRGESDAAAMGLEIEHALSSRPRRGGRRRIRSGRLVAECHRSHREYHGDRGSEVAS
ncbi:hypothetical protein GCM10009619_03380 [Williamsia maris]